MCPRCPTGVPIPQAAQAGPGGRGCIRRCVGVVRPCAYLELPRVVHIPEAAQARAEGLGCIRRYVGLPGHCLEGLPFCHRLSKVPKFPGALTRGDDAPRGPGHVAWGASPSFMESQNASSSERGVGAIVLAQ